VKMPSADEHRPARRTQTERSSDTQERILAAASAVSRGNDVIAALIEDASAFRLLWDRDPERCERVKKLAYDAARRLYDSKRSVA
jgi:hypothetical protein